ncbi:MAG: DUF4918 family protein [Saprospiraceae bacterium]|nr:DUF4918 family protein [Saprospiraceae bacterium]
MFYHKYYNDNNPRRLILGINPQTWGRINRIPFTDTKRLNADCGILFSGFVTHEPSSVFIYEMIKAYGGTELFYGKFFISSVCPLGFVKTNNNHKVVNYNYYDAIDLQMAMEDFIVNSIRKQIALCGMHDICYCLGTGKNYAHLNKLNKTYSFFERVIPLEHPRYIMQYKSRSKSFFIDQYLKAFNI